MNVDFDLHGIVGIRILDAQPSEIAAVRRQLGPIEHPLSREPDILIRFADEPAARARRQRIVALGESAEEGGRFVLLAGRRGRPIHVEVPLDDLGGQCEIVCRRGTREVPHLVSMVNLTALARGFVPVHASAFLLHGRGVLVTGWAKGGKTEVMLGMVARGATPVGDEWIYIDPSTRTMYGIREPVRVWDWHLRQLPEYRERVPRASRLRLGALRPGVAVLTRLERSAGSGSGLAADVLRRIAPVARRRMSVQVEPEVLFSQRPAASAAIDQVILVANHTADDIIASEAPPMEVVDRVCHSLAYERLAVVGVYHQYGYALPGHTSALIEQASSRERDLLTLSLDGTPAHVVEHPYPVNISALCDRVEAIVLDAAGS